ncbi:MAG: glycosyltransferase N-terminal domain-containing protein [Planctomycetota bacterium]
MNGYKKSPSAPISRGASIWLDALYLLAAGLLIPYFIYRCLIKKKSSAPLRSKLGYIPERDNVPRVWIHAVSVGEAPAAETLFKALKRHRPELDVVVSTTTVTGQSVAVKRYGENHSFYYPLDLSCSVKRALDRVKPSALVLMELEIWPNMISEATARDIPVVVVNGRITERSFARYRRFWFLVGNSFRCVQHWLMQSDEYAARLKALGVEPARITIAGNIKYDAVDIEPTDLATRAALRESLGIALDAPVLIGGSTHPTEETALLAAYTYLRNGSAPRLRLILVPRHPERIKDVLAEIAAAGYAAILQSELKEKGLVACLAALSPEKKDSCVLVINTVGELKSMYRAADAAFIGGSLIPHGGQNIMEPCGLNVPVLHGPYMHNFNDAMSILRACQGAREVTRETLISALEKLLANRQDAAAMAARAREGFLKAQGATEQAAQYVLAQIQNR